MVELDQGGRLAGRVGLRPSPELSGIVESSFVLETAGERADSWRIVPDLSAHVLLHFRESSSGPVLLRAGVSGAKTRFGEVSVRERCFSVGARLAPGALHALTGLPGEALLDRSADVRELWGDEAVRLIDLANEDPRPDSVRRALIAFLTRISRDRPETDWRVRGFTNALRREDVRRLDTAIGRVGVAPRTMRRACREIVGLGPKHMARIQRLYRCLGIAKREPALGGARLAGAAGYADQPHMIRESKTLLGESPRRFLARGQNESGRFVQ